MEKLIAKYLARLDEAGVPEKVSRRTDWNRLHPKVIPAFLVLGHRLLDAHELGNLTQRYLAFEGYRAPEAQLKLVAEGTSKARPWQSGHNYGLCVDWVGWSAAKGWNWLPAAHPDWREIGVIAVNHGLVRPITWDKPHVEHPLWTAVKRQLV